MRRVPWITLLAAGGVAISPLGQDVYHSSFLSGERLSNRIGQFLLMIMLATAVGCAAIEVGIRYWLLRRRVTTASGRAP